MDTSETYIKMCEKAEEIQCHKAHRPTDMYLHKGIDGDEVMAGYNLAYVATSVWLPRQDQLQEMWLEHKPLACPSGSFHFLMQSWIIPNLDYANKFTSMEQLWLAFVMKEKYGKVWAGSEWVQECGV